jgi:predicted PurR-regulated permease PerM
MTLALALIAALMSFIPFIGPILSVFPALLIGLLDGPATALWVAVIYSVVQILEGNLVTPIIERRTLHVPPAALLLGQMVMALLFGFFGVLLATPLLVIGITLVQMLYIEDVLGERVTPLGGD